MSVMLKRMDIEDDVDEVHDEVHDEDPHEDEKPKKKAKTPAQLRKKADNLLEEINDKINTATLSNDTTKLQQLVQEKIQLMPKVEELRQRARSREEEITQRKVGTWNRANKFLFEETTLNEARIRKQVSVMANNDPEGSLMERWDEATTEAVVQLRSLSDLAEELAQQLVNEQEERKYAYQQKKAELKAKRKTEAAKRKALKEKEPKSMARKAAEKRQNNMERTREKLSKLRKEN